MTGPLVRWLWRGYLRRHWPVIALAVLLMAIEGGMLGLLSWIIKPMFDQVFVAGDRGAMLEGDRQIGASGTQQVVMIAGQSGKQTNLRNRIFLPRLSTP